jgi:aspartyl-tRNA(Asn)/glutamyl-tRNA(Gln) amidotransferase subunit C
MSDSIDAAQVEHIAALARLSVSPADVGRFQRELSAILEYFGQLSAVETSQVTPLSHPLPVRNVWAEDESVPSIGPGSALLNAPQHEAGFFLVPRVLEDSEP